MTALDVPRSAPTSALVRPVPPNCSFSDSKLVLDGKELPFIRYDLGAKDEIWFPAKPVMLVTGETTITHCLDRVASECKMSFKELVESKGLPEEGCCGFATTPDVADYHQGKAMWVDESGLYAILLGSRKPQCASFQRWVLQEVLPSIRRSGGYHVQGSGSQVQEVMVAMELRLSAAVVDAATAAATAAVTAAMAQVQQQHGVLEISRSRPSAQSERLKAIGTVVDDRTLQGVQDEGGMLAISVFLQEAGVKPELLRRLLPGFAEEAGRRKLERWHGTADAGPLWIAWSQCAWRILYTEADRPLLCEVFEDPLTQQQLRRLDASQPSRAVAATQGSRRRRSGPYDRPLQGSSSAVSSHSIRSFFG
jgi:prophage antirepressor-like protein